MAGGRVVIKGVTRSGRKFRPSDWAERIVTSVGSATPDRHIRFHPMVHMATIEGVNCVVVEQQLRESEPLLYDFLIRFGADNDLLIEEQPAAAEQRQAM